MKKLLLIILIGTFVPSGFVTAQIILNNLIMPSGIAEDSLGRFYVTDYYNSHVFIFSPKGILLNYFGSLGSGKGQFNAPQCIDVDKRSGNIYVTDEGNNRVQVFNKEGAYLFQFGSKGSKPGQFINPIGVRVNPIADEVYVVDSGNNRVQLFDTKGVFKKSIGSGGQRNGEFYFPQRIAFGPSGKIYVADQYNHRIQIFSKEWNFLAQLGKKGSNNSEFLYPAGIAVDKNGRLYVSDVHNARIQVFSEDLKFIRSVGNFGYEVGQFSFPTDIAVLDDRLFVCDRGRVQEICGNEKQSLRFDPIPSKIANSSPFFLHASSTTNNPISYFSSDTSIARIDGNRVQIMGPGAVVVTAIQNGTADFAPVSSKQMLIIDPFWKVWWFMLLVTLWLIVVTYVIVLGYTRSIKRKAQNRIETEARINKLQMTALKSQMSPHFIFNCLNTINSYVLKSEAEMASEYLARFAKLMRLVLENSEETVIPLKNELEMIDMYLSLEVIRFGKKIEYKIINEDADPDFEIPSMSLQPFIENAIWHGLLHKFGTGKIQVIVSSVDEGIKCVVEDDGIGRENAARLRTNPRKSFGMSNTTERLRLLNKACEIHIIDLKTDTNDPAGTRVEILFKGEIVQEG